MSIKIQIIGYKAPETLNLEPQDAVNRINLELANNRTIFIDNVLFSGSSITEADVAKTKRSILIANQLVGG